MASPIYYDPSLDLEQLLNTHSLPELSGQRLLLTGCTGFFGFWLLSLFERLNQHGQPIEIVALSRSPQRFLELHPRLRRQPWLSFIEGDVSSFRCPAGKIDAIIHGATDTSPEAASQPQRLLATITDGTRHLLDIAAAKSAPRLLLISSGAIYGTQFSPESMDENIVLEAHPLSPDDAYGNGKRIMEAMAFRRADIDTPQPLIARCFAFIGPGLPNHLAPAQFMLDALRGGPILIRGDGKPIRSYLYAADLAVWLLTILARGTPGRIYNVGGAQAIALSDLAEAIQETIAPDARIEIQGQSSSGPRQYYVPDTTRAREELDLKEWTDLPKGLEKMAHALKHHL